MCLVILLFLLLFLFGRFLSSYPETYIKFTLKTIYGYNLSLKPLSCNPWFKREPIIYLYTII